MSKGDEAFAAMVFQSRAQAEDRKAKPWPKAKTLVPALMEHLAIQEERTGKCRFRVSGMYRLCPRAEILSQFARVVQEPIEPPLRFRFDIGSAVHDWIQNRYLGPMKVLWGEWKCQQCKAITIGYRELKCRGCGIAHKSRYIEPVVTNDEYDLIGHYDGQSGVGADDPIYELKTIDPDLFTGKVSPDAEHVFQVRLYMKLATPPRSKGIILYIDKCGRGRRVPFREFLVEQNDSEAWDIATEKIQTIRDCERDKRIPPRYPHGARNGEGDISVPPCRWCYAKEACWDDIAVRAAAERDDWK